MYVRTNILIAHDQRRILELIVKRNKTVANLSIMEHLLK